MRLMTFLLFFACFQVFAGVGYGQYVTINCKNERMELVLQKIEKQTGYSFFYNDQLMRNAGSVSITVTRTPLKDVLNRILAPIGLGYSIEDKVVIISKVTEKVVQVDQGKTVPQRNQLVPVVTQTVYRAFIRGLVQDEKGLPIPGASIIVTGTKRGTISNSSGEFLIDIQPGQSLTVTAVGYEPQQVAIEKEGRLLVKLKILEATEENVVINTGLFSRRKESFTGATTTFSGNELRTIGNLNVVQSLKTLDPSFIVLENNLQGSNPNALPTIELRGKTSLAAATLNDEFAEDPNQPLFILDGFPTTLQRITDLDINRIESVTLLKDAASTAIYGAKAANGVVVVETVKPKPGELRVSYNADFMLQMPDLSDYNLMNAAEKLEFERLAGRYTLYTNTLPEQQIALNQLYDNKLKEVQRGVNTYWMNEPLRTAVTNGHSLQVSGGSKEFMFSIGGNYRMFPGIMKGSGRNTYGANIDVTYRIDKFSFVNRFNLSGSNADESPYGSFSLYSRANPYYRKYNDDGSISKYLEQSINTTLGNYNVYNPLYDAQFNNINNSVGNQIQNQLSLIYSPGKEWRFSASANVIKNNASTKTFAPPELTRFEEVDLFKKGQYSRSNTTSNNFQLNVQAAYAKIIERNRININLQGELEHRDNNRESYIAVGFPAGSNGNPIFSFGYPENSRPGYANSIARRNNLLLSVNYSFDDTYFADLTGRMDGSTAFGSARKYTPFWSVGLGWNLHKRLLSKAAWINLLRLKGSIGYTGNQNIGSTSSTSTYTFEQAVNYFGQGMSLTTLGNNELEWQKTLTKNLSIDYTLFNNRLTGYVNFYDKNTDPLIVVLDLPASTGLYGYGMNAGMLNTKGVEFSARYAVIYKPKDRFIWNIGINGAALKSRYDNFGAALAGVNKNLLDDKSLTRYKDGYSPDDVWAVRSLGIDPATGKEIFLKINGQQTFDYSTDDIVRVGNSRPAVEGVINNSVSYKGLVASIALRYRYGGDIFNTVLFEKVENISIEGLKENQDKRALYERWKNPGDISQFKSISSTSTSPASSRFLQDNDILIGESISLGWQFMQQYNPWIKKLRAQSLGVTLYANDIFRWASTLNERGIDYPFSRNVSLKISASF